MTNKHTQVLGLDPRSRKIIGTIGKIWTWTVYVNHVAWQLNCAVVI